MIDARRPANARRRFLAGAAALASSTFLPRTFAAEAQVPTPQPVPTTGGARLDMAAVMAILSEQGNHLPQRIDDQWLDLDGYSDYTQDALDYLVDHAGGLEGFNAGFRSLSPEGAKALTRLDVYYCFFNLVRLDVRSASILGGWDRRNRPLLGITTQEPLPVDAAFALIPSASSKEKGGCGTPLVVGLPSICPSVARALAGQDHELFLHVGDGRLSPHAAEELARHRGYSLSLYLDRVLPDNSIRALASNPEKRLRLASDERRFTSLVDRSLGRGFE